MIQPACGLRRMRTQGRLLLQQDQPRIDTLRQVRNTCQVHLTGVLEERFHTGLQQIKFRLHAGRSQTGQPLRTCCCVIAELVTWCATP
jgi:hypothetical protein